MLVRLETRPMSGSWPSGLRPESERILAPFGGGYLEAETLLTTELGHLGAAVAVIELAGNVKIRKDGQLSGNSYPQPPVRVSFQSGWGPLVYSTDRYDHWVGNLHAVGLGLQRLRAIDRYGISTAGEQYTGWAALPSASGSVTDPVRGLAELIGWPPERVQSTPMEAVKQGRKLSHPDATGEATDEDFLMVQQAAQLLGVVTI